MASPDSSTSKILTPRADSTREIDEARDPLVQYKLQKKIQEDLARVEFLLRSVIEERLSSIDRRVERMEKQLCTKKQ